jgi:phospholipid/cholesterol/gamma-HCH transport system substrate-binding protein
VAQRRLYFLVGLFVTVGIGLGVAAVVWLGASRYFQKGSMYVTYFDESVQGLQVDSLVKFRGVDIGSVRKIGVAPDQRLVEVMMKLDVKDFNVTGVVAKLTLAGITGIVYVELDRGKPGEPSLRPTAFEPPYPVIPSAPSDIRQIESGINDVLKSVRGIDFKGISDQVKATTKSIDGFVNGERTKHIMRNAEVASAKLASSAQKIDNFVAGGSIEEVVAEARDAVKDARSVMAQIKTELEGVKMGQTMGKVNQFVEGTSRRVESTLTDVSATAESLRRASDSLDALIDRLSADPSALIFSRPPKGE